MYTSINQIKEDFQLNTENLETLRESLNQIRIELHPDKNRGKFRHDEEKEKYYRANDAIQYIDGLKNNNQLIVVEKMTELVKIVVELIPNTKETSLQSSLDVKIDSAIGRYKSKLYLPKISLTALTGLMTFLFTVPTQIKDNVVLSRYLNPQSSIFVLTWLTLLLYTGIFWVVTFINGEKAKGRLSLLKVDSTQNDIFESFLEKKRRKDFTKDELTEYIFEQNSHGSINVLLSGGDIITMEVAQNISEIIVSRAEKKGIIEKSSNKSLSDKFTIKD